MAYIHYDQKPNGVTYACVYESYREKGKVKTRRTENLGRVVDKEKGLFCQKGVVFQYTIEAGRKDAPDVFPEERVVPEQEKLILDFGDAWFLEQYLCGQPFYSSIEGTLPDDRDTLLALIFYRLLTHKGASCHAKIWYEGNYSYLSFPHADLTSQNISRILKELGREEVQRAFFENYLACVYGESGTAGILVDSTGVPNSIHFPLTAMCATRLGRPDAAIDALLMDVPTNTYLVNGHNWQNSSLRCYLPGNGGLLTAVAMMCAGYDGCLQKNPGFPKDGRWRVRWEGLLPLRCDFIVLRIFLHALPFMLIPPFLPFPRLFP